MQLTIKHNFPDLAKKLDELHEAIKGQATASAINKTIDQARTQMARQITDAYALPSAYVKQRLRVRGASAKGGMTTIEATLIGGDGKRRAANIIAFAEKKTTLAQARKRAKNGTLNQLYVKVKRAGPAKPLKGAFIGNKGRTVFERVGKARLPIKPVQVIDVPQMFTSKAISKSVIDFMNAKFPEVFEREARFYLTRYLAR